MKTPLILATVAIICAFLTPTSTKASSAVAIAVDAKTGKWQFGYWFGPDSEGEVKHRAIRACIAMGGTNPKIIASTGRRGYGAVVLFAGSDKKTQFAVSLGAGSEEMATKEALQKAKAAGGRYARVARTWNDTPAKRNDVINL